MYYEFYDEDESMNEFIENEMERVKKQALKTISSIAHFKSEVSTKSFIEMFVYCWQESLPVADTLAQSIDLGKLEMIALAEEFDAFKKEYMKDMEKAGNF